jgi:hypothetical protein
VCAGECEAALTCTTMAGTERLRDFAVGLAVAFLTRRNAIYASGIHEYLNPT